MPYIALEDNESGGLRRGKQNSMLEELYTIKVESGQVITRSNTVPYTPTQPYHPATKLYVDEMYTSWQSIYDPGGISADMFDRSNHTGTQAPSTIVQDINNRFVSDAQIAAWNSKEDPIGAKGTAFNKNFGTGNGDVARGDHTHNKNEVNLDQVDNTADINKPVSIPQQSALNQKANLTDVYSKTVLDSLLLNKRDLSNFVFAGASFDGDGFLQFKDQATVWNDFTFPMSAYRLDFTTGTLQYNYTNASITMDANGDIDSANGDDYLMFNCQIPHSTKLNSTAKLHIHWEQPADQAYEFKLRWRIQRNGQLKTANWSDIVTVDMGNNSFVYGSGTLIQITSLLDIDLTGIELSSIIQVKLTRSDATAGNIEALAVDFHFEIDTLGSKQEFSKV